MRWGQLYSEKALFGQIKILFLLFLIIIIILIPLINNHDLTPGDKYRIYTIGQSLKALGTLISDNRVDQTRLG